MKKLTIQQRLTKAGNIYVTLTLGLWVGRPNWKKVKNVLTWFGSVARNILADITWDETPAGLMNRRNIAIPFLSPETAEISFLSSPKAGPSLWWPLAWTWPVSWYKTLQLSDRSVWRLLTLWYFAAQIQRISSFSCQPVSPNGNTGPCHVTLFLRWREIFHSNYVRSDLGSIIL